MLDPYEILGVRSDASLSEIKAAYKVKAKETHPDLHGGSEASAAAFRRVTEAYSILSDSQRRANYDKFKTFDEDEVARAAQAIRAQVAYVRMQASRAKAVAQTTARRGIAWFVGGTAVTILGFALSDGSGHPIFWGAIIFGGIQAMRGFIASARIDAKARELEDHLWSFLDSDYQDNANAAGPFQTKTGRKSNGPSERTDNAFSNEQADDFQGSSSAQQKAAGASRAFRRQKSPKSVLGGGLIMTVIVIASVLIGIINAIPSGDKNQSHSSPKTSAQQTRPEPSTSQHPPRRPQVTPQSNTASTTLPSRNRTAPQTLSGRQGTLQNLPPNNRSNGIPSTSAPASRTSPSAPNNRRATESHSESPPLRDDGEPTVHVQAGDTLWGIATRLGTTVTELKAINGLTTDTIVTGQVLLVPSNDLDLTNPSSSSSLMADLQSEETIGRKLESETSITTQPTATRIVEQPTKTENGAPTPAPSTAQSQLEVSPETAHDTADQSPTSNRDNSTQPDFTNINQTDRTAMERTCQADLHIYGPAKYNTCLQDQINQLSNSTQPDFTNINQTDRTAMERTCQADLHIYGPAKYNTCLQDQLNAYLAQ